MQQAIVMRLVTILRVHTLVVERLRQSVAPKQFVASRQSVAPKAVCSLKAVCSS